MAEAVPQGLGFQEAIDFFRQKVRLPTRTWTDLWEGQHARAFVVAGAMKDELLADFQQAIQKALNDGTTLADFRKDFDAIVARHGWSYKGGRNWRSRVIFDTNLRTAAAAGRWEQIQRVKERRPYLRYVAVLDSRTRPEHRAWHGTILPVNHPWWHTHYPPNGWRCRCTIQQLSERDLARFGYEISDGPPPSPLVDRTINTPGGPTTIRVPEGVDPGFAYNVGIAHSGTRIEEAAMEAWRRPGAEPWEPLGGAGDWSSLGRPAVVPADPPKARLGPPARDEAGVRAAIEMAIGGPLRDFRLPDGTGLRVDAAALARHVAPRRAALVPFLPELLNDPFEIWLAFERHRGTGQVRLAKRLIKIVDIPERGRLVMMARAVAGVFLSWTFVDARTANYVNNSRRGNLTHAR